MTFGSVCSGIESASAAWNPLGWSCRFFAEIDPFCCALLARRYPEVPNLGDINAEDFIEKAKRLGPIDVLVGGPPCQAFSIAGLRGGLADPRGNLTLRYLAVVDALRPTFVVYENVPGILNSVSHAAPDPCAPEDPLDVECDGAEMETEDEYDSEELHAFNSFVAGLSELRFGIGYASFDAQFFHLAQRRERVFVVGYPRAWQPAAAILFDCESMSGYPAPRRETGERVTGTLSARTSGGGGLGTDFDIGGGYSLAPPLTASGRGTERTGESRGQDCVIPILEAGGRTGKSTTDIRAGLGVGSPGDPMYTLQSGKQHAIAVEISTGEISHCLNAGGMGRIDYETETLVTHALRADGFDASEDGTGRGTPIVAVSSTGDGYWRESDTLGAIRARAQESHEHLIAFNNSAGDTALSTSEDTAPPITTRHGDPGLIAFSCKDSGNDASEISPTLRAMEFDKSHANAGCQVAVAFDTTQITSKANYSKPKSGDPCHPLAAGAHPPAVAFRAAGQEGFLPSVVSPPITHSDGGGSGVPTVMTVNLRGREGGGTAEIGDDVNGTLRAGGGGGDKAHVLVPSEAWAVRRLTPKECERLQGFKDGYTLIPYRGKLAADGPRYKALGNAMAVPCMAYIGRQIEAVAKALQMC